ALDPRDLAVEKLIQDPLQKLRVAGKAELRAAEVEAHLLARDEHSPGVGSQIRVLLARTIHQDNLGGPRGSRQRPGELSSRSQRERVRRSNVFQDAWSSEQARTICPQPLGLEGALPRGAVGFVLFLSRAAQRRQRRY